MFKMHDDYKKLFATDGTGGDVAQVVQNHFQWVMFSHTWEGEEPRYEDVSRADSVWKLQLTNKPLNVKLCEFCVRVSQGNYRWAWSDTCCIDKSSSAIENQSIISMYTWYSEAAETIIYLADATDFDSVSNSRWLTRAWTFQELLASKVIRFYNKHWQLCHQDGDPSVILTELASTMGTKLETIASFSPKGANVQEMLRLASQRNATVEEDIAFSLIGVFSSDIVPRYGLGKDTALGLLLENIVGRSGDTSVIAWTGRSSQYNSALPESLLAYKEIRPKPFPTNMNIVEQLRGQLPQEDCLEFYDRVVELPRPTFANRRLHLPCIVFPVTNVRECKTKTGTFHQATVSLLGKVDFNTADIVPKKLRRRQLIFVHPWLRDLIDPGVVFPLGDEPRVEPFPGSVGELEGGPEESNPDSGDEADYVTARVTPSPLGRTDEEVLRLISHLWCPFNVLLLEGQSNGQYRRIAAEHEIMAQVTVPPTNFKLDGVQMKVVEIV